MNMAHTNLKLGNYQPAIKAYDELLSPGSTLTDAMMEDAWRSRNTAEWKIGMAGHGEYHHRDVIESSGIDEVVGGVKSVAADSIRRVEEGTRRVKSDAQSAIVKAQSRENPIQMIAAPFVDFAKGITSAIQQGCAGRCDRQTQPPRRALKGRANDTGFYNVE